MTATETRDRVLDAALASFGTRGYEATSLDSIAAACGVRKQTILYHFNGKEALLAAVIDRSATELASTLERSQSAPGEGWGRVEAIVRSVFRLAARRPELLGLVREVSRLGPPHADRLTKALEPLIERAIAHLKAEMRLGRLRQQDPRLVLMAAYSMVVGFATEVDIQRALGYADGPRSVVRRRAELLTFLRTALVG